MGTSFLLVGGSVASGFMGTVTGFSGMIARRGISEGVALRTRYSQDTDPMNGCQSPEVPVSCDICGRGSCSPCFHSLEEQEKYEKVIEAFDRARELREKVRNEEREGGEE